jgi:hypothetical protein
MLQLSLAAAAAHAVAAAATSSMRTQTLRDFGHLNAGTTTSSSTFRTFAQCTLADVEGRHGFKTGNGNGSWAYLYTAAGEAPPLGMRSAVPLGSLGTGSVELRSDGSFHDWLLENQGPGLIHTYHKSSLWPGGKVDKPEFLLGLRAAVASPGGATASSCRAALTLRTAPPADLPAADALIYSGAWPAAQLRVSDTRLGPAAHQLPLNATFRAYSPLRLRDAASSNTPSLVLELQATNAGSEPLDVSFLAVLPAFTERDQGRINHTTAATTSFSATGAQGGEWNATGCRQACAALRFPNCAVWTVSQGQCRLGNATVAATSIEYYEKGSWSGVMGRWAVAAGGGLVATTPGAAYFSGTKALVPGTASGGAGASSEGVGDSLQELWARFDASGGVGTQDSQIKKRTAGSDLDAGGCYGATTVGGTIAARETMVLRVVLAWHHPNRFHFGSRLGNWYAVRYADALAVAEDTRARLADGSLVRGIQEWHDTCHVDDNVSAITVGNGGGTARNASRAGFLPLDFRDFMVNSMSQLIKTSMWFADGSWRQLESFSDDDPDPVHIHLYRSIPYAAFFPELSRNLLLTAYAKNQEASSGPNHGYIHENFPLGIGQTNLGRAMGDTSTAFILDVYQLHKLGGANAAWLRAIWPHVKAAAGFQIRNAQAFGLPTKLTTTYDWFALESHEVVSYNAFLHISALHAAVRLARLLGNEGAFITEASTAAARGAAAVDNLLWHEGGGRQATMLSNSDNHSYYAAYFDHGVRNLSAVPLLTDTLYGALWAAYLGLPLPAPRAKLLAHLASERELQSTPYGLRVWHPVNATRRDRGDAMVWQGGSMSHAALSLYLGESWAGGGGAGILPAAQVIGNYKHRLRDWWDWKDLNSLGGSGPGGDGYYCASAPPSSSTGSAGVPWCNSHYTRQLIGWAVPAALSGQQFDPVRRTLRFSPAPGGPRLLPVFTAEFTGTLDTARATLTMISGRLDRQDVIVTMARAGARAAEQDGDEAEVEEALVAVEIIHVP